MPGSYACPIQPISGTASCQLVGPSGGSGGTCDTVPLCCGGDTVSLRCADAAGKSAASAACWCDGPPVPRSGGELIRSSVIMLSNPAASSAYSCTTCE